MGFFAIRKGAILGEWPCQLRTAFILWVECVFAVLAILNHEVQHKRPRQAHNSLFATQNTIYFYDRIKQIITNIGGLHNNNGMEWTAIVSIRTHCISLSCKQRIWTLWTKGEWFQCIAFEWDVVGDIVAYENSRPVGISMMWNDCTNKFKTSRNKIKLKWHNFMLWVSRIAFRLFFLLTWICNIQIAPFYKNVVVCQLTQWPRRKCPDEKLNVKLTTVHFQKHFSFIHDHGNANEMLVILLVSVRKISGCQKRSPQGMCSLKPWLNSYGCD